MTDPIVRGILTDSRIYIATAIGLAGMILSSRRVIEQSPALSLRFSEKRMALMMPLAILFSDIFILSFVPYESRGGFASQFFAGFERKFDWVGGLAHGILYAFGFVFSLRLVRIRDWLHRGVGLLFAVLYAYAINGTIHAWIARAENGHL